MKITIACSKGGTGKTTTTILLATAMAEAGLRVAVWDADPQGDATDWADSSADSGEPLPFDVIPVNMRTVRRPVPTGIDHVLIDTNPHTPDVVQAAIDTGDFVVVPTTPSPRDMSRVWLTLETVADRPHRVLVCRADLREIPTKQTIEALDAEDAPRFTKVIAKATAIVKDSAGFPRSTYGYDEVRDELLAQLG